MAPDSNNPSHNQQAFHPKIRECYMTTNNMRAEFYRFLRGHKGRTINKFFDNLTAAQRLDFLRLREANPEHLDCESAAEAAVSLRKIAARIWADKGPDGSWVSNYLSTQTNALRMHRLADYWLTLQALELELESESDGATKP